MTIKTRFSPSPTGQMHLGNVRTALFSYLLAHQNGGRFLLRIEDTDKARSRPEFTDLLKEDLNWLGLNWDDGPYFQSERQSVYQSYYDQLEQAGKAYPCFCSDEQLALSRKIQLSSGHPPRYAGTCSRLTDREIQLKKDQHLMPALRFRVPDNQDITFIDLIKGPQKFNSSDIGDFIIRRADGSASFFFCNAVDDSLMGVTHAIRGEDHLTNSPRQMLILQALVLPVPQYGHLPLILNQEGGALSKRENSQSLENLREQGYLPQALHNYLGRLGHYYAQTQLLDLSDLIKHFSLARAGKTPARFDEAQLNHWQKQAVMQLTPEAFKQWLSPAIYKIIPENFADQALFDQLMQANILFPQEAEKWAGIFYQPLNLNADAINLLEQAPIEFPDYLYFIIEHSGDDYDAVVRELSAKTGLKGKQLYQPLRIMLSGQIQGPDLRAVFKLLGKARLIQRIQQAKKALNAHLNL